jgi:hypothetical protein
MVVFAGKVGAPSLQIRCGIDELAASFVESGAADEVNHSTSRS